MLAGPSHLIGSLLLELGSRNAALRTFLRSLLTFINVTANCTNPFLHSLDLLYYIVCGNRGCPGTLLTLLNQ